MFINKKITTFILSGLVITSLSSCGFQIDSCEKLLSLYKQENEVLVYDAFSTGNGKYYVSLDEHNYYSIFKSNESDGVSYTVRVLARFDVGASFSSALIATRQVTVAASATLKEGKTAISNFSGTARLNSDVSGYKRLDTYFINLSWEGVITPTEADVSSGSYITKTGNESDYSNASAAAMQLMAKFNEFLSSNNIVLKA